MKFTVIFIALIAFNSFADMDGAFFEPKKLSKEQIQNKIQIVKEIQNSKVFKELVKCNELKDKSCLKSYFEKDFLAGVATAGDNQKICVGADDCIEYKNDEVMVAAKSYVTLFIDIIKSKKLEKISVLSNIIKISGSPDIIQIDLLPGKDEIHLPMVKPIYSVELKTDSLKFKSFGDGNVL